MYTHIYIQIILERPSTCSHQTNPLYFRSKLAIIGRCLARATKYDAWDVRFISLLHYFQNGQIVTPNIVVIDLFSWQISVCHKTITVTGTAIPWQLGRIDHLSAPIERTQHGDKVFVFFINTCYYGASAWDVCFISLSTVSLRYVVWINGYYSFTCAKWIQLN